MNKFQNIEEFTDKQKEEFYKRIGSNVARIRKKHKLSQLKLSLLIGHKSTSLLAGAEIYYNKQHFSLEHLANISFVLNEDITEFFKSFSLIVLRIGSNSGSKRWCVKY
jgi:transcriptional regulator with XRE-family HTH domain